MKLPTLNCSHVVTTAGGITYTCKRPPHHGAEEGKHYLVKSEDEVSRKRLERSSRA